jgi:hypothetical protein
MTTNISTLLAAFALLTLAHQTAFAGGGGEQYGNQGCVDCATAQGSGQGSGGGASGRQTGSGSYTAAYGIHNYHGVRAGKAYLQYPWHCNYYHTEWGTPVALAIPPTAERSYDMGWGVGNTRLSRNWHQFQRPYPGAGAGATGRTFAPTPPWPSDTSQFGVHYIRGPW